MSNGSKRMVTQEPQKQVVSWKQYLETLCATWTGHFVGLVLILFGILLLLLAVSAMVSIPQIGIFGLLVGAIVGGAGIVSLWMATTVLDKTEQILPVTLISRHNASLLPEAETLVRASAPPLSLQQTELLRVASPIPDTPAYELLRPVTIRTSEGTGGPVGP